MSKAHLALLGSRVPAQSLTNFLPRTHTQPCPLSEHYWAEENRYSVWWCAHYPTEGAPDGTTQWQAQALPLLGSLAPLWNQHLPLSLLALLWW